MLLWFLLLCSLCILALPPGTMCWGVAHNAYKIHWPLQCILCLLNIVAKHSRAGRNSINNFEIPKNVNQQIFWWRIGMFFWLRKNNVLRHGGNMSNYTYLCKGKIDTKQVSSDTNRKLPILSCVNIKWQSKMFQMTKFIH